MGRAAILDGLLYATTTVASAVGLLMLRAVLAGVESPAALLVSPALLLQFGGGILVYGVGMLAWTALLGRGDYSVVVPATIALTVIASDVGEHLLLDEPVGVYRLAGTGLIVLGLVMLLRPRRRDRGR